MASKKTKDTQIAVRLAPDIRRVFLNKAAKYGGTSHVLREMVSAFNEDRIKIEPPSLKGTLYETH